MLCPLEEPSSVVESRAQFQKSSNRGKYPLCIGLCATKVQFTLLQKYLVLLSSSHVNSTYEYKVFRFFFHYSLQKPSHQIYVSAQCHCHVCCSTDMCRTILQSTLTQQLVHTYLGNDPYPITLTLNSTIGLASEYSCLGCLLNPIRNIDADFEGSEDQGSVTVLLFILQIAFCLNISYDCKEAIGQE